MPLQGTFTLALVIPRLRCLLPTQIASLGSRDFAAATTFSEVDYAHPQNHFRLPHAPRSLEIVYVGLHHYGYNRLAAQDAMHCKLPHASR